MGFGLDVGFPTSLRRVPTPTHLHFEDKGAANVYDQYMSQAKP